MIDTTKLKELANTRANQIIDGKQQIRELLEETRLVRVNSTIALIEELLERNATHYGTTMGAIHIHQNVNSYEFKETDVYVSYLDPIKKWDECDISDRMYDIKRAYSLLDVHAKNVYQEEIKTFVELLHELTPELEWCFHLTSDLEKLGNTKKYMFRIKLDEL